MNISIIGIDLAMNAYSLRGTDAQGKTLPKKPFRAKTGSSLGCGWAMSQILAGGNPVSVTASHRPSIEPCRSVGNNWLDA